MSLCDSANNVVKKLVGCSLNSFGRAANLFWFTFSHVILHNPEEKPKIVSEYALHIQCRWRLRRETTILIGFRDLYYPKDYSDDLNLDDFDWDVKGSSRFDMLFEKIQSEICPMKVISANANELGELAICFEKNYLLETFIDLSLESENWRLFLHEREDLPHWVQEGNQLTGE